MLRHGSSDLIGLSPPVEQGFAIGNGLTNPEIQYKAYSDYALEMKLITKPDYDSISQKIPDCEESVKTCGISSSFLLFFTYLLITISNEIFEQDYPAHVLF